MSLGVRLFFNRKTTIATESTRMVTKQKKGAQSGKEVDEHIRDEGVVLVIRGTSCCELCMWWEFDFHSVNE